jgi:hypothetical protein
MNFARNPKPLAQNAPVAPQPTVFPAFSAVLAIATVVLLLGALIVGIWSVRLIPTHGDTTYPESAIVLAGIGAEHTGKIYTEIHSYPYTAPVYGPLLYLGIATLARVFHGDFGEVLLAGRAIDFTAFLLIGLLVYIISRNAGFDQKSSLLGAFGTLATVQFVGWNVSVRPDIPSLALGLAALYFASAAPERQEEGYRKIILSGLCVAAAILIKQSMFTAGLSILIWLIIRGQRRAALIFIAASGVPVLVTLGVLSQTQPILSTMTLLRYAPKDWSTGLDVAAHAVVRSVLLLGFGIGGVLFGKGKKGFQLLRIYFITAWLIPPLMMMQVGADVNYLFDGWVACGLLIPAATEALRERWSQFAPWSRIGVLVFIMAGAWLMEARLMRVDQVDDFPRADELKGLKTLSDNSYLSAHGSRPELLDPFMNRSLALTGHWSPQPILQKIDGEYYDVALVRTKGNAVATWRGLSLFDESILKELNTKYRVLCRTHSVAVLVPHFRQVLSVRSASEILNDECLPVSAASFGAIVQLHPYEPSSFAHYFERMRRFISRDNDAQN